MRLATVGLLPIALGALNGKTCKKVLDSIPGCSVHQPVPSQMEVTCLDQKFTDVEVVLFAKWCSEDITSLNLSGSKMTSLKPLAGMKCLRWL